jgi:hypothetical protein
MVFQSEGHRVIVVPTWIGAKAPGANAASSQGTSPLPNAHVDPVSSAGRYRPRVGASLALTSWRSEAPAAAPERPGSSPAHHPAGAPPSFAATIAAGAAALTPQPTPPAYPTTPGAAAASAPGAATNTNSSAAVPATVQSDMGATVSVGAAAATAAAVQRATQAAPLFAELAEHLRASSGRAPPAATTTTPASATAGDMFMVRIQFPYADDPHSPIPPTPTAQGGNATASNLYSASNMSAGRSPGVSPSMRPAAPPAAFLGPGPLSDSGANAGDASMAGGAGAATAAALNAFPLRSQLEALTTAVAAVAGHVHEPAGRFFTFALPQSGHELPTSGSAGNAAGANLPPSSTVSTAAAASAGMPPAFSLDGAAPEEHHGESAHAAGAAPNKPAAFPNPEGAALFVVCPTQRLAETVRGRLVDGGLLSKHCGLQHGTAGIIVSVVSHAVTSTCCVAIKGCHARAADSAVWSELPFYGCPVAPAYARPLRSERGLFRSAILVRFNSRVHAELGMLFLQRCLFGFRPVRVEAKKSTIAAPANTNASCDTAAPAAAADATSAPAKTETKKISDVDDVLHRMEADVHALLRSTDRDGFAYPRLLLSRDQIKYLSDLAASNELLFDAAPLSGLAQVTVMKRSRGAAPFNGTSPALAPAAAPPLKTPPWAPATPPLYSSSHGAGLPPPLPAGSLGSSASPTSLPPPALGGGATPNGSMGAAPITQFRGLRHWKEARQEAAVSTTGAPSGNLPESANASFADKHDTFFSLTVNIVRPLDPKSAAEKGVSAFSAGRGRPVLKA